MRQTLTCGGQRTPITQGREVAAVFIIALAYLCPFVRVLWRVGDEGTILYGAARVAHGSVPFRDFFEVMGPFSFYWPAFWFKLLGTNWAVARSLLAVTGALIACLIYWTGARVYGRHTGLVAALVATVLGMPLWPANNHHWDSNLFFLAGLATLTAWQSQRRRFYLLIAGMAAGVTAGFMIQKGGLLLAAGVALVSLTTKRDRRPWREALGQLPPLLIGFAAVVGSTVLWFHLVNADWQLYYANIAWPFTRYGGVNRVPYGYGFREFLVPIWLAATVQLPRALVALVVGVFSIPFLLVLSMPLLLGTVAIANRLLNRQEVNPAAASLWIGGAALWLAEAHRMDISHLLYGAPVLLTVLVGEVLAFGGRASGWRRLSVVILVVACLCLGTLHGAIATAARVTQETRRGTVYELAQDEALAFLMEHTQAGESFFVYPYYPMYYFLADLRNPTKSQHPNVWHQHRRSVPRHGLRS